MEEYMQLNKEKEDKVTDYGSHSKELLKMEIERE